MVGAFFGARRVNRERKQHRHHSSFLSIRLQYYSFVYTFLCPRISVIIVQVYCVFLGIGTALRMALLLLSQLLCRLPGDYET